MSAEERLSDGQAFGRYQIVRLLGEGGMGAVYEAIHVGLKKRVALKTLLPSIARNPEAQTRFLREGEAASRINHPNVVDVTDVGSEDGTPYLVMEYLEGETLADYIDRQGPLRLAVAVDLLLPCIDAVAAGHDRDVIHRDLKPQNVFLARASRGEPVPKILDFGVSKIVNGTNASFTGTMAVLGTASYMSPEQARGAKVITAASDQYAVGLVFFEMLTATRAHDGESPLEVLHRISSGVVPNVSQWRPDLPPDVVVVLTRMHSMNPSDRFPSLRDAARALLSHANEKTRVAYADAFHEHDAAGPLRASSLSARGLPLRPGSGGSGGTRLLPKSGSAQATTLGQMAIESRLSVRRRSRLPLVLLVGGVVAAVAVVFVVQRKTVPGVASAPTTATSATSASSAPAAAELPHSPPTPAVTAPPHVVEVPSRTASPAAAPEVAEPSPSRNHLPAEVDGASGRKEHAHPKRHDGASPKPHLGENQAPILD
jgi:serine/threonine protein kinase